MNEYHKLSREELINKIEELESAISILKEEKDNQELINFPWIGNLGSWSWYVKTDNLYCNLQKVMALGYSHEEIPKKMGFRFFTDKLHPEDYEDVMEDMRRHLKGLSPAYEVTYRIRTKENKWKWYYDRGKITKRDEFGRPEIVSGIVFDITEQKNMESLLKEQNEQLLGMANTDYLTNVCNRKSIDETLQCQIARTINNASKMCLLILDIDHFKKVNDTYGHLAGDIVLVQVVTIIKNNVRDIDVVGRYGGEEFLVIMPDCILSDGIKIAEKIRHEVEKFQFTSNIKLTISGGIVEESNQSIATLIDEADKNLYVAKTHNRNKIVSSLDKYD